MKRLLLWIFLTLFLMILIPWLTVTFAGSSGMAICLVLFFCVNPLFSVIGGVYAGKYIKTLWIMPAIVFLFYLAGIWIFFDAGEMAFVWYGGIYFLITLITMIISKIVYSCRK